MNLFYKESQSKRKKNLFFWRGGGGVSGVGSGDRGGGGRVSEFYSYKESK